MEKDGLAKSLDNAIEKEGFISQSLSKDGIPNKSLSDDHLGIENISSASIHIAFLCNFMPTFDELSSEFRECFQKMGNNMDICRKVCQMLRKFPDISETE